MIDALALVLRLVAVAGGDCHLVTNSRIIVLPSCEIGPATIAQLTEDPAPSSSVRAGAPGRLGFGSAARPAPALLSTTELQHRLDVAEGERVAAVSQRYIAERERDAARRDRDAALREVDALRRELASVRATIAARARPVKRPGAGAPPDRARAGDSDR